MINCVFVCILSPHYLKVVEGRLTTCFYYYLLLLATLECQGNERCAGVALATNIVVMEPAFCYNVTANVTGKRSRASVSHHNLGHTIL